MFRGRFLHAIDPKGRLSIPAKFREAIADTDGTLVVVPNGVALEVHPLGDWQRIEAKVRDGSLFDAHNRKTIRLYMSKARDVRIDGNGRILLPPEARAEAALNKDVWLVGGPAPYFEVWDKNRFEDYERNYGHELPELFDRLASRGV